MTDVFQQRVQRLDRSVRVRDLIPESSSATGGGGGASSTTGSASAPGSPNSMSLSSVSLGASSAAVAAAVSGGGGVTPSPVAVAAMGNAGLLLDDAILSEQCSAAELTFFREAALDFNVPLSDLADSITAVISTVVKLRSGIPDDHELKLMRSHLNTVTIEMQLLAKHLEFLEDSVSQLGDDDHWIKREATNVFDAMRALEEKVGLFRLYLKDVAGPSGASHRHKLLFASQYLVETAVQLLRAIDVAALETTIQMAVRTALVAQRIFAIAFRKHGGGSSDSASESGSSVHEKHTPLKSLMPLLTDCLVSLTNGIWKRGLQLPDPSLRQQLDESCTNIGATARVFIDVCSERRKMVMRNSKRPSSSSRLRERVTTAAAVAAAAESQQQKRRGRADSDSDAASGSTSNSASPAPLGKSDLAKKASEALDLMQLQLAHVCALLAASSDSPTPGASLASEVDCARKQLFRIIDTHLHSESALRPDGGRSGPSKAELSGNAVLQLAMLLKRLVVDFESLKLVPGSLTASAVAVSGIDGGGDGVDERPVMRVTSIQSLSKLIRELTQTASRLVEQMPPSPMLQQVHVFIVVARRYLLRLQLACMAQVAGSPIQVHVPLPLLLRGMATTLSLLVRGLDEIGVVRTEREAWKQQRGKSSRHRRRSQRIRGSDSPLELSAQQTPQQAQSQQQQSQPSQADALDATPELTASGPPTLAPSQTLQPSSSSASLSSSTGHVKRIESSGDEKSSRNSSLRSGSLRHRESPSSSRPGSKPGSLRSNRRSTELLFDAVQHANSSPPRMSTAKRKSLPPSSVNFRDD